MSIPLFDLCAYLDEYLQVKLWTDYCWNGLQLEGKKKVEKIVTAVSASLDAIEQAVELKADADLIKRLNLDAKKAYTFYRSAGCAKCRNTGFKGRSVISEILLLTPEIKDLILKRTSADEIKQKARRGGMNTLRESGVQKAMTGETSLDEIFRVTAGDQELEVGP